MSEGRAADETRRKRGWNKVLRHAQCKATNRMTAQRCTRVAVQGDFCDLHSEEKMETEAIEKHQCSGINKDSGKHCHRNAGYQFEGQWFCRYHDPSQAIKRRASSAQAAITRYGKPRKNGRPKGRPYSMGGKESHRNAGGVPPSILKRLNVIANRYVGPLVTRERVMDFVLTEGLARLEEEVK